MRFIIDHVDYIEKSYPLHKHNNYEIIIYLSGKGKLHTLARDYPVKTGSIIVIPPKTVHGTISEHELKSIYINGELNQLFNFTSPVILSDNTKNEGTLLAGMIYDNRYGNEEYVASLCSAFMHFIVQNLEMEDNIGLTVNKIIHKITENFHDSNLNLCALLRQSGYAEDYIRANFKRITGKTPTAFLTDIRIKHACYLIDIYKNTHLLSEIAEQCGYTDYIYFSRKFKMITGISPQKYKDNLS